MGALRRQYRLGHFVETGTWRGDGLLHAMGEGFKTFWSIEASPELALTAQQRVQEECPLVVCHWGIIVADSPEGVSIVLERLYAPTLWWLDAHLPERYATKGTRLPLQEELERITSHGRGHLGDVFLIDDWRLYERGNYGNGNFLQASLGDPDAIRQLPPGDPDPIRRLLEPTHTLNLDLRDEGYMVALPR